VSVLVDLAEGLDPGIFVDPFDEPTLQATFICWNRELRVDKFLDLDAGRRAHRDGLYLGERNVADVSLACLYVLLQPCQLGSELSGDVLSHVIHHENAPVLLFKRIEFLPEETVPDIEIKPSNEERSMRLEDRILADLLVLRGALGDVSSKSVRDPVGHP